MPVSALTSGNFTYEVVNDEAVITSYNGSATNVTVPATIDGYSVYGIGDSAFKDNINIEKITVPAGVKSVGASAFENCTNLKYITIPETVTVIDDYAFANSGLKQITFPLSLTEIGEYAFSTCSDLTEIKVKEGNENLINKYMEIINKLKKALNKQGWDGKWYRRAYTDVGNVLGSSENDECKIDSIAQSWSTISDAGDNDKKYISMEALEKYLINKKIGIIKLLDPPFEKGKLEPGYIKAYLPGVRENGGQYTHAAIWAIIAFAKLKLEDKACTYFNMINPINHSNSKEKAERYKVEPYVIPADIYGSENLLGRGGWTWYTGSSSWYYIAGIEYILGLKIQNQKLTLNSCIPKEWNEYFIHYKYGESIYNIRVKNINKTNQVQKIILNNQEIQEKEVTLIDNGKINDIEIIL